MITHALPEPLNLLLQPCVVLPELLDRLGNALELHVARAAVDIRLQRLVDLFEAQCALCQRPVHPVHDSQPSNTHHVYSAISKTRTWRSHSPLPPVGLLDAYTLLATPGMSIPMNGDDVITTAHAQSCSWVSKNSENECMRLVDACAYTCDASEYCAMAFASFSRLSL